MDVYQVLYSSISVLFIAFVGGFVGVFCSDFRVYSDVDLRVVGVQLTKYSLAVMREYGRHGEPCN